MGTAREWDPWVPGRDMSAHVKDSIAMASFTVNVDGGNESLFFADDDSFKIGAAGVLVVSKAGGEDVYFSPAHWSTVEVSDPQDPVVDAFVL